jgi:hypothetical protein
MESNWMPPTVARTYRQRAAEISFRRDPSLSDNLIPVVSVIDKDGTQTGLTTTASFANAALAEEHGQDMAREWIDGHIRG